MNITELAIYKKMFGGGTSGATAYTVSSVDELPSDAVDGSMAIVDVPDPLLGTWVLNSVISVHAYSSYNVKFVSNNTEYWSISIYGALTYHGDPTVEVYTEGSGWADPAYQTIMITGKDSGANYTGLINYLNENGTQTEVGKAQALYTHKNGQWVYKCEVV